ncbi:NVEALA domain-containing protein [Parabacteroides bouchesdurhonensis]|uniref:NVEALA domain-containing protein n=1 Tax=Parabacteroides bouchesdurhonensis TaxID=1936995 RepID=UPI000E53A85A|nr:NVEALA domain-containing protein [Parabacteroides bouchesdurhonensis]RHJ93058.1 hypothetical protein DW095_06845 [Bacteroides sp. AM07-16]
MKKKLFGIAIVAMIAVAAAWNMNENKNEVTLSDVALDNVEALAEGESSGDFTTQTGCVAVWYLSSCYGKDGQNHSFAVRQ